MRAALSSTASQPAQPLIGWLDSLGWGHGRFKIDKMG
jgi:hypothetical protein